MATYINSLEDIRNPGKTLSRLKAIDWAFTSDNTRYLSHDIHPYPAKFIPQIPHHLIQHLSLIGETVWDPFGGSGTTALEALLLKRNALSTDANPLAEVIGNAKILTLTTEDEDEILSFIEQLQSLVLSKRAMSNELKNSLDLRSEFIPDIPNFDSWFHAHAISELSYIRWRISSLHTENCRSLSLSSFSRIILKASYQDSETRYVSKPREVHRGDTIKLFIDALSQALNKVRELGIHLQFRRANFKTVDLRMEDALTTNGVEDNSVDLVVTSPPYPNATDYHLYHRFRMFWLGFDPRDLANKEIGSHLRHQRETQEIELYLEEMSKCLQNVFSALRSGRYAVFVIGDAIFKNTVYHTSRLVEQRAQDIGFEIVGTIDRPVHSTKRSFSSAARRLRKEQLLVLRKPPQEFQVRLFPPTYKLWPYEDILRTDELKSICKGRVIKRADSTLSTKTDSYAWRDLKRLTFSRVVTSPYIGDEVTWQSILENGDSLSSKTKRKDPKYVTHGIHPYKGKFYPQLAKSLFNLSSVSTGDYILDPFCGSGTVLLESYLNGYKSVGTELNPLAVKIAKAKTEILDVDAYLRDHVLSRFEHRIAQKGSIQDWKSIFSEDTHDELHSWFPLKVLRKLAWLLNEIHQVSEPRIRELLEVILSSIVRDISQQDPKDLRIRRRKSPIKDAPVFDLYIKRLSDIRARLQHFSERCVLSPVPHYAPTIHHGDSRDINTFPDANINKGSVDLIVTSPPYATALPYIDTDRLSILLLFGFNSRARGKIETSMVGTREISKKSRSDFDSLIQNGDFDGIASPKAISLITEIRERNLNSNAGFRRQNMAALLYMYYRDMTSVLSNLNKVLSKGGQAFFVIGDNKTTAGGKEIRINSGQILQEIGNNIGWKTEKVIPITVTTENRRNVKHSITENEILWFRKK